MASPVRPVGHAGVEKLSQVGLCNRQPAQEERLARPLAGAFRRALGHGVLEAAQAVRGGRGAQERRSEGL
eukprot:scaffold139_cov246-Pinguiococcus_pyrenoidosus.AAC.15